MYNEMCIGTQSFILALYPAEIACKSIHMVLLKSMTSLHSSAFPSYMIAPTCESLDGCRFAGKITDVEDQLSDLY